MVDEVKFPKKDKNNAAIVLFFDCVLPSRYKIKVGSCPHWRKNSFKGDRKVIAIKGYIMLFSAKANKFSKAFLFSLVSAV